MSYEYKLVTINFSLVPFSYNVQVILIFLLIGQTSVELRFHNGCFSGPLGRWVVPGGLYSQ